MARGPWEKLAWDGVFFQLRAPENQKSQESGVEGRQGEKIARRGRTQGCWKKNDKEGKIQMTFNRCESK